ncbi:MAG: putative amidohydrolase YtcJ [Porticoccaceae bacterium]
MGFNYDDSSLDVARHPTKDELDEVAPNHPVYLWHRSGHMGVANSLALEALGCKEEAPIQAGVGVVDLPDRENSGQLSGLLQGGALPHVSFRLRKLSVTRLFKSLLSARDQYLSAGITTAQNGFADIPSMLMLRWSQRMGLIPQRLVVWPAHDKVADRLELETLRASQSSSEKLASAIDWGSNPSRSTITAIKLVADGSPQGRTAWLAEPYLDGLVDREYRGYPNLPELQFKSLIKRYQDAGVQFSIHSDAPVTPISPMQVMWSATNRKTLTGMGLGPALVIDRERALRAMTIDAAWQSRLDHDRGSLEMGELADFVVLSEDPLTYPDARTIDIEQIWINGKNETLD